MVKRTCSVCDTTYTKIFDFINNANEFTICPNVVGRVCKTCEPIISRTLYECNVCCGWCNANELNATGGLRTCKSCIEDGKEPSKDKTDPPPWTHRRPWLVNEAAFSISKKEYDTLIGYDENGIIEPVVDEPVVDPVVEDIPVVDTESDSCDESDNEDSPPDDTPITMTEKELEALLDKRYWEGFNDGKKDAMKKPKKEKKVKSPSKPRSEYAKAKKQDKCSITEAPIRNLSSFKFSHNDAYCMQKSPDNKIHICRFTSKDGQTITEYCPWFCVKSNETISTYVKESKTMEKMGVWSNSTQKLPGKSWGFREGIDYITYSVGDNREAYSTIIKSWINPNL